MPDHLGPFMDKAAELHDEIDRLNQEVILLALAGLALALLVMGLAWKVRSR